MKDSVVLPKDLKKVPLIRENFRKELIENGFSEKRAFDGALVLDELANNAIEHGSEDQIFLEIEIASDQAIITCENGVTDSKINAAYLTKKIGETDNGGSIRGRGLSKLIPHYTHSLKIEDAPNHRIRITAIIGK